MVIAKILRMEKRLLTEVLLSFFLILTLFFFSFSFLVLCESHFFFLFFLNPKVKLSFEF